MNDLVHLIVLTAAGVREDDQFSQQSKRENLHAEYDQERGKQQCGAVRQWTMKIDSVEHEVQKFQNAHGKSGDPDHAKKSQRFFGKAHEKKYVENVEEAARIATRQIYFSVAIFLRLPHGYFLDAKALTLGEDR